MSKSPSIPFTRILTQLPAATPFVGPEALERRMGRPFDLRIGANESAFGVSPKAAAAMCDEVTRSSWYADPEGHALRSTLAERHGVEMDEICLGGGIDELLGLVVRMTVEPGAPVVTSLGAYPTFNYHVAGHGGALHPVPYREDHNDLEGLTKSVRTLGAGLVYLANPDNPMGTWHDAETVRAFMQALPENTVLVLDEAYIEFAPGGVSPPMDTSDPRIIRMRTFSKAHGMAGARIGYAIASKEMVVGFNKVRNHFGINRIAMAGALASLGDTEFIENVVTSVAEGREEYYELASQLGLTSLASATNFVAMDVGDGDRARGLLKRLQDHGVFVRMPGVPPLDRCLRITVGTGPERRRFAEVFADVVNEAHGVGQHR